MRRLHPLILLIALTTFGFQKEPEQESLPFQWLSASGETSGVVYETHKLQPISLRNESGVPVEIEQEVVKVDAQTTRITRRAFNTSVNGGRELTETVVEEIRKSGEHVSAVRTTSRKDANGQFNAVQKDVQEITPAGAGTFKINRTYFLPGSNNALVQKEQVQQIERRQGDKTIEIDRTTYLPDLNGTWSVAERRTSQNSVSADRSRTDEQVYKGGINNQLSVAQQIKVSEWKDPAGQRHWQAETYDANLEGKLQLNSRLSIIQTTLKGGHQETTQVLEKPSPTAPNEGLRLAQKVVENLQAVSPKETERQLDVLEPDLNGGMRSIFSQQGVEVR